MPARIINLRTRRKQKARVEDRAKADTNAAKHGQSLAKRKLREAEQSLVGARLDGHRLGSETDTDE